MLEGGKCTFFLVHTSKSEHAERLELMTLKLSAQRGNYALLETSLFRSLFVNESIIQIIVDEHEVHFMLKKTYHN